MDFDDSGSRRSILGHGEFVVSVALEEDKVFDELRIT